ncbi:MAG TPA: hypothetical protein VMB50_09870, partial [Myxococcales bacterium]|nr:hypothetical protein [Myxococcales bacterium]
SRQAAASADRLAKARHGSWKTRDPSSRPRGGFWKASDVLHDPCERLWRACKGLWKVREEL